jgi:hypothetical protein
LNKLLNGRSIQKIYFFSNHLKRYPLAKSEVPRVKEYPVFQINILGETFREPFKIHNIIIPERIEINAAQPKFKKLLLIEN